MKFKINDLEFKINSLEVELENATTIEERRLKEKQIETKELLLHDLNTQLQRKQSLGKSI